MKKGDVIAYKEGPNTQYGLIWSIPKGVKFSRKKRTSKKKFTVLTQEGHFIKSTTCKPLREKPPQKFILGNNIDSKSNDILQGIKRKPEILRIAKAAVTHLALYCYGIPNSRKSDPALISAFNSLFYFSHKSANPMPYLKVIQQAFEEAPRRLNPHYINKAIKAIKIISSRFRSISLSPQPNCSTAINPFNQHVFDLIMQLNHRSEAMKESHAWTPLPHSHFDGMTLNARDDDHFCQHDVYRRALEVMINSTLLSFSHKPVASPIKDGFWIGVGNAKLIITPSTIPFHRAHALSFDHKTQANRHLYCEIFKGLLYVFIICNNNSHPLRKTDFCTALLETNGFHRQSFQIPSTSNWLHVIQLCYTPKLYELYKKEKSAASIDYQVASKPHALNQHPTKQKNTSPPIKSSLFLTDDDLSRYACVSKQYHKTVNRMREIEMRPEAVAS